MVKRHLLFAMLFFAATVPAFAGSKTAKEEYELQERCGKQAAEVFKKEHGKEGMRKSENGLAGATYINHYNRKLNKCFLLLTNSSLDHDKDKKPGFSSITSLRDINEHKEIAFIIMEENGRELVSCDFLEKSCQSESEHGNGVRSCFIAFGMGRPTAPMYIFIAFSDV